MSHNGNFFAGLRHAEEERGRKKHRQRERKLKTFRRIKVGDRIFFRASDQGFAITSRGEVIAKRGAENIEALRISILPNRFLRGLINTELDIPLIQINWLKTRKTPIPIPHEAEPNDLTPR